MTSDMPIPGGAKAGGAGPRILLRHYFSTHLLWTAFHATQKAKEIEDAHTGESTFDIEHSSYVLSVIVSAAGFLEAAINEFFQDAHDEHNLSGAGDGYLAPLSSGRSSGHGSDVERHRRRLNDESPREVAAHADLRRPRPS
jgi:hypothetical protein